MQWAQTFMLFNVYLDSNKESLCLDSSKQCGQRYQHSLNFTRVAIRLFCWRRVRIYTLLLSETSTHLKEGDWWSAFDEPSTWYFSFNNAFNQLQLKLISAWLTWPRPVFWVFKATFPSNYKPNLLRPLLLYGDHCWYSTCNYCHHNDKTAF